MELATDILKRISTEDLKAELLKRWDYRDSLATELIKKIQNETKKLFNPISGGLVWLDRFDFLDLIEKIEREYKVEVDL